MVDGVTGVVDVSSETEAVSAAGATTGLEPDEVTDTGRVAMEGVEAAEGEDKDELII